MIQAQGALDHPAAGQDLEGVLAFGPADDLHGEVEVGRGPGLQFPGVNAVGPGPADAAAGAVEVEQQRAASRSWTLAGVAKISSSRPPVSTAMCHLRPLTFLALSQ